MNTEIKYIDKAGLEQIFQIIAKKDESIIGLLNAMSTTIRDMKQNMLTVDNFENGFTKTIQDPGSGNTMEEFTNNNKISVGLIHQETDTVADITKLLSIKEQGIDYADSPSIDFGTY